MQAWRRLDIAVRYRIADALFSGLVVTPLAVLYSYGTGAIIRRVSTDHAPLVTSFLLFCAAVGVQFAAGYRQRDIAAWFSRQPELYAEAAKRVYIFVYALSNVCHYTALNTLFDIYVESDKDGRFHAALELLASTIIVLAGLRCCRNVMGLPLHVAIDTESTASVIETTTIFGVQQEKTTACILDVLTSVVVVETSVVLHWIALWRFYDVILFPQNSAISAITSWIVGYTIVTAAICGQSGATELSRKLEDDPLPVKRLAFEDAYIMVANAGCVLVWRGWWLFFEGIIYYFPAYCRDGVSDCSLGYAHFFPFVLLCVCYTSSSLLSKGCERDGEAKHGEGVRFSIQYFLAFFKEEILGATDSPKDDSRDGRKQYRETICSVNRTAGRHTRYSPAREDSKYANSHRTSPRRRSQGAKFDNHSSFTRGQNKFDS